MIVGLLDEVEAPIKRDPEAPVMARNDNRTEACPL